MFKQSIGISMLLASFATTASVHDLYAGKHTKVGEVETFYQGGQLLAQATITEPGWCLTKSHLYVGEDAPKKSAPGSFKNSHDLGCSQSDVYRVDVSSEDQYVAYHAEVSESSYPLGGNVQYRVEYGGIDSFFDGFVNGIGPLPAWCVDIERVIGDSLYNCELRSIFDQDLGLIDREENIKLVYWLLNQDLSLYPGISWEDVQGAIWTLVDDQDPQNSGGGISWNQSNVDFLVELAEANGQTFNIDDQYGLVLLCRNANGVIDKQITVVMVPTDGVFVGEETAWADGNLIWQNRRGKQIGWGSFWIEYR